MNRRRFVTLGSSALIALAIPGAVFAEATPSATATTTTMYVSDFMTVAPHPLRSVFRAFTTPEPGFLDDALISLEAYGFKFAISDNTKIFAPVLAEAYRRWNEHVRGEGWTVSALQRSSVRSLGDWSHAWTFDVTNSDSRTWEYGIVATVQDAWMQMLIGEVSGGSSVSQLAAIAEKTLSRWPTKDLSGVEDGIHVGDVWAALPTLDDVPEGISFDFDQETSF